VIVALMLILSALFSVVAAASVDHLRRYIELLFQPAMHKGRKSP